MTGAFGIRLSRANERIRNAKKHIIQILDSSHVARRANGREKKEFLFRFRLLFAMANCVRVMRKRRAHTHTRLTEHRPMIISHSHFAMKSAAAGMRDAVTVSL